MYQIKKLSTVVIPLFMLWGLGARPVSAASDPATKLARGFQNLTCGWFEVANEVAEQSDKHGLGIGVPAGLIRGAVFGVGRMGTGAVEMVTFLVPHPTKGFDPVLLPESVFTRH